MRALPRPWAKIPGSFLHYHGGARSHTHTHTQHNTEAALNPLRTQSSLAPLCARPFPLAAQQNTRRRLAEGSRLTRRGKAVAVNSRAADKTEDDDAGNGTGIRTSGLDATRRIAPKRQRTAAAAAVKMREPKQSPGSGSSGNLPPSTPHEAQGERETRKTLNAASAVATGGPPSSAREAARAAHAPGSLGGSKEGPSFGGATHYSANLSPAFRIGWRRDFAASRFARCVCSLLRLRQRAREKGSFCSVPSNLLESARLERREGWITKKHPRSGGRVGYYGPEWIR